MYPRGLEQKKLLKNGQFEPNWPVAVSIVFEDENIGTARDELEFTTVGEILCETPVIIGCGR
jgi:hypothetical protein